MKKQAFFLIVFCMMILTAPLGAVADMRDVLTKFHPYLTFQEEYTDNLDLTPNNRLDDWITTCRSWTAFFYACLQLQRFLGKYRHAPTQDRRELTWTICLVWFFTRRIPRTIM